MKKDTFPDALISAGGIAAYAMATSTLRMLMEKGVLSAEEARRVLDRALVGIEELHAAKPSIELHIARELIERSLSQLQGDV